MPEGAAAPKSARLNDGVGAALVAASLASPLEEIAIGSAIGAAAASAKKERRNPRLVPIDRAALERSVLAIARQIVKSHQELSSPHVPKTSIAVSSLPVSRPKSNETFLLSVRVIADEPDKPVLGYILDAEYGRREEEILIRADRHHLFRSLVGHKDLGPATAQLTDELRTILSHEMTHGSEYKLKPARYHAAMGREDYQRAHANDPQEVTAIAQSVAMEILATPMLLEGSEKYQQWKSIGPNAKSWVEWVVMRTNAARPLRRMTDANRKRALQLVERALREAGVDTQGQGALPNSGTGLIWPIQANCSVKPG